MFGVSASGFWIDTMYWQSRMQYEKENSIHEVTVW